MGAGLDLDRDGDGTGERLTSQSVELDRGKVAFERRGDGPPFRTFGASWGRDAG